MNAQELLVLRKFFQINILKLDGQGFQDFFIAVMTAQDKDLTPVKPQGSIGDRKNDGFNKKIGLYFQVYSPEDPSITVKKAIEKLDVDFKGLKEFWDSQYPIKQYKFALNDKYQGAYPELLIKIADLEKSYPEISFNVFLAKDLEDTFLLLPETDQHNILGFIPAVDKVNSLNFSVLTDVVDFLRKLNKASIEEKLVAPDFTEKIQFNGLSDIASKLLHEGSYLSFELEKFFNSNSDFVRQELKNVFSELYLKAKTKYENIKESKADFIFFEIISNSMFKNDQDNFTAILVLMSFYFESCDIFEEPNYDIAK